MKRRRYLISDELDIVAVGAFIVIFFLFLLYVLNPVHVVFRVLQRVWLFPHLFPPEIGFAFRFGSVFFVFCSG